jgi:acylphosphatase
VDEQVLFLLFLFHRLPSYVCVPTRSVQGAYMSLPTWIGRTTEISAHGQVIGHVQGVSFRVWAVERGKALHLRGWVSNTSDGAVEGAACGSQESVEELCVLLAILMAGTNEEDSVNGKDGLKSGPSAARVEEVKLLKDEQVASADDSGLADGFIKKK